MCSRGARSCTSATPTATGGPCRSCRRAPDAGRTVPPGGDWRPRVDDPLVARAALRRLLAAATAAAGRAPADPALPQLVAAAPLEHLPAAAAAPSRRLRAPVAPRRGRRPRRRDGGAAAPHADAALRHLVTGRVLGAIGRQFDDAGVRWVVMKGPALTDRALSRSRSACLQRPRSPRGPRVVPGRGARARRRRLQHKIQNWALARWFRASEIGLVGQSVTVDLHWAVQYASYDRRYSSIDADTSLERRRLIDVAGRRVPTFDAVDTLLHLALHAARSNADHLLWFKDIERSLAVDEPDLDEFLRARRSGCAPSVGVATASSPIRAGRRGAGRGRTRCSSVARSKPSSATVDPLVRPGAARRRRLAGRLRGAVDQLGRRVRVPSISSGAPPVTVTERAVRSRVSGSILRAILPVRATPRRLVLPRGGGDGVARRNLSRDGFVARLTREVQPVADLRSRPSPQPPGP